MSNRPSQRDDGTPIGGTPGEAAMLAFVEGEMGASEELAFRRSLRHAPQVLASLEGMRRDKALLRASLLREPLPPSSLAGRVDEALAREALLGGRVPEPLAFVEPAIRTRVVGRSQWGTRLAIAAGVALAVGGAFLALNRPLGTAGPGRGTTDPLAMGDERSSEIAPTEGVESNASSGAAGEERVAASGGDEGELPQVQPALPDVTIAMESERGLELMPPAVSPGVDVPEAMGSTRLLPGRVARQDLMALAEQHRLALRVSADEPRQVIAALEAAAAADPGDSGWRVLPEAPISLASALGISIAPFGEDAAPAGGSSGGAGEPAPGLEDGAGGELPGEAQRTAGDWLLRPTEDAFAVYLAEVDMSEEGLAALDRELRRAGRSDSGFAALADPLERVLGERMMLVPANEVIWWYQPPREWSRRTLVPVVVERR